MLEHHLDRHAFVVIIGGGAVLDVVGFAASLVHRGLRVVRLPTTVLGQCDSGVGVKTAVNFGAAKNLVGTFAPPFAVVNDFDLLDSLPDRDWRAGIAEAFKVALIKDAKFFRWLCRNATALRRRESQTMAQLVTRCAELHLDHISRGGDPFELGHARPLDFGHWSAHRLEVLSRYRIGHGHAVAAGIALDAAYAVRLGHLAGKDFRALVRGLLRSGLPVWYPEMVRRARSGQLTIFQGLEDFREHLGGELALTLPHGIGKRLEINVVDQRLMEACATQLKELNSSTDFTD
jgi:3-dehydroquinate synthase